MQLCIQSKNMSRNSIWHGKTEANTTNTQVLGGELANSMAEEQAEGMKKTRGLQLLGAEKGSSCQDCGINL